MRLLGPLSLLSLLTLGSFVAGQDESSVKKETHGYQVRSAFYLTVVMRVY